MEFLDLFSGIGGFRRGLERSGHRCIGHVEIDKYANISYMAMYGLSYCKYSAGVLLSRPATVKNSPLRPLLKPENAGKETVAGYAVRR